MLAELEFALSTERIQRIAGENDEEALGMFTGLFSTITDFVRCCK